MDDVPEFGDGEDINVDVELRRSDYAKAEERRQATPARNYPLTHRYYDWFSSHEVKNDALFVYTAITQLLGKLKDSRSLPKRLTIWSDGGPKHFKLRRGLFYMWLVCQAVGIPIEWHFFASCHGKCRCDGHFGSCKSCHRRLVLAGTDLTGVSEYVRAQNDHVPDTEAWPLEEVISPGSDVNNFKAIKIRSMHRFCFEPGSKKIKACL